VGLCILAGPEIVGAVIVIGVVVAAVVIVAELEKAGSCDDMFTACLGTSIASIPGPLYGHSQMPRVQGSLRSAWRNVASDSQRQAMSMNESP
jgi:hypothetical protein